MTSRFKKKKKSFLAVLGLHCFARAFSSCREQGLVPLCCGSQASPCTVFSCCRAQTLGEPTSVVAARGLSSCDNPCQYFRLGNPKDRGAWRGTVHGVTKELDLTEQLENNSSTWREQSSFYRWESVETIEGCTVSSPWGPEGCRPPDTQHSVPFHCTMLWEYVSLSKSLYNNLFCLYISILVLCFIKLGDLSFPFDISIYFKYRLFCNIHNGHLVFFLK